MNLNFKFYEVGGKIRDELLGLTSNDVDYVAVPSEELLNKYWTIYEFGDDSHTPGAYLMDDLFNELKEFLEKENFKIFLITPNCFTIRAKFPEGHKYQGVADFVMATI